MCNLSVWAGGYYMFFIFFVCFKPEKQLISFGIILSKQKEIYIHIDMYKKKQDIIGGIQNLIPFQNY